MKRKREEERILKLGKLEKGRRREKEADKNEHGMQRL